MKNNVKRIISLVIASIIFLIITIMVGMYIGNSSFRLWIDKNVLKRNIAEEELPTIDIEESKNTSVYAYGNYIAIIEDNTLSIYNKSTKKLETIDVSITTPKFASNGNYLLVADEGKSSMYLIYNDSLQWEKEVEGKIAQVTVNKNGAVGVIITGTTYKSVVIMYDIDGNENFKTYLSTTTAIDLAISEDNQYLSFIEINTSGTTIVSKVKTISVEKAKSSPNEAIINTYETDSNVLLLRIKYYREKLVAYADDAIHIYSNGNDEKIFTISSDTSFVDINLNGYICIIRENSDKNSSNEYELDMLNVESKKTNAYFVNDTVKAINCYENIVAVNMGNEVDFINTNGWLVKKFTSFRNIKEIIVGDGVAAIVHKDSVEIIDL